MLPGLKIQNKILLTALPIILITIIGVIEWSTGYQISFAFFYLVVLSFFALYQNISPRQITVNAIFAAITSLVVQIFSDEPFEYDFIPYTNAIINLAMFVLISFLCYSLNLKQKHLITVNEHLSNLNTEKNRMIGIAAHDLRGPFGNIQSLTKLMMHENHNSENLKLLEMMDVISSNSVELIDKLLDVSTIEAGILKLNLQPHNYGDFVRNSIGFLQLLANNKKIIITLDCSYQELIINYDETHTRQVLTNLLTNAIKFSKAGSEIQVRITKSDLEVLTEVIDEGVGIPEQEIGKLFNFFQQTSSKPTSGEKGSGLGLAIAKKIVLSHGGSIGIKSELNKGSNFYFYLPLQKK